MTPKWLGKWFNGEEMVDLYKDSAMNAGIGSAIGAADPSLWASGIAQMNQANQSAVNQQMAQQIYGMVGQQGAQVQNLPKKRTSWKIAIDKIENGFVVCVVDMATGTERQYIAADMPAILEQISVGMVLGKLEA